MGAAVLSDVLDATIRDPEQVARAMKTEVLATLPSVKTWRGRLGQVQTGKQRPGAGQERRERNQAISCYEEAIRTLRNSILLTDFDRSVRSMLVTSATPSEGKSTAAVHLAVAHAEQNHKTLLIDGDLRRPSVHRRFNIAGTTGLSQRSGFGSELEGSSLHTDRPSHISPSYRQVRLPAGPPILLDEAMTDLLDEA